MDKTEEQDDEITNVFDVEVPLPTAEGDLFGVAGDRHLNAYVYAGSWDAFALSYREAADQLVKDAAEGRAQVDFLALPVIFLYRQYLEVRLKELALAGSDCREVPRPKWIRKTHDLLKLWHYVRPLMEAVCGDEAGHYEIIEQRLQEFAKIDRGSDTFRYPEDTSGKQTLPGTQNINLGHLRDIMAGIVSVLDGSSTGLYEYQQAKSENYESAAEMPGEYRP